MLLSNTCGEKNKKDSFIRCRTVEKKYEELEEEETMGLNDTTMEYRVTKLVANKEHSAAKTNCNIIDKSYAEAIAVQPKILPSPEMGYTLDEKSTKITLL